MRRSTLGLVSLALLGWGGAVAAQVVALGTDDTSTSKWTVRRDRFLLLGSVSTNAIALSAAYRFMMGRRGELREPGRRPQRPERSRPR